MNKGGHQDESINCGGAILALVQGLSVQLLTMANVVEAETRMVHGPSVLGLVQGLSVLRLTMANVVRFAFYPWVTNVVEAETRMDHYQRAYQL